MTDYISSDETQCARRTGTPPSRAVSALIAALGSAPVEAVCVGFLFVSILFISYCDCIRFQAGTGAMSSSSSFPSVLQLVTGGLYAFVTHLMTDKRDEFSGLEGLYVQLAGLRSTPDTTVSRGLNLFSVCLFFFHSLPLSVLLRCALTRFSPKLCLGPE